MPVVNDLDRSPWATLGVVPEDGYQLDLRSRFSSSGRFLQLRVVVLEVDDKQPLVIRTVTVEWGCPIGPG